jgi:DNA-binding GntR family transcriptional regulator
MALSKISNKTLRQRVYEELKERIISADLLPGQEVNIMSLSKQMGVSAMPVREALRQLDSEQIVIIKNNRASKIRELTQSEFDEILKIRLNLEVMAGKEACTLRKEVDVKKVEAIVKKMHKVKDDMKTYLKLNRELHFSIYSMANSPVLLNIIDGLWARVGPYFNLQIFTKEHLNEFLITHMEMCDALKQKNKSLMAKALKTDIQNAKKHIMKELKIK